MNNETTHPRMSDDTSTVLIASDDLVAGWSEVVMAPTDLIAVSDTDVRHALDIVRRHRPRVVVLEQIFSSTARGLAFVNDLRSDPELGDIELRMLPEERTSSHCLRAATNGRTLANMCTPLNRSPSRRVRRVWLRQGTGVVLDGTRVELVELSTLGARVVSPHILRPNQSVRITVKTDGGVHRAEGTIAWSTAEPGPDRLSFRAGVSFRRNQPELLSSMLSEVDDGQQITDPGGPPPPPQPDARP